MLIRKASTRHYVIPTEVEGSLVDSTARPIERCLDFARHDKNKLHGGNATAENLVAR
jgi:hypothetical protein